MFCVRYSMELVAYGKKPLLSKCTAIIPNNMYNDICKTTIYT